MTWHAKTTGAYSPSSQDAIDNATEAMQILMIDYGWTKAACCGMFGNIDYEGGWNPWRWERDIVRSQSFARNQTIPSGWTYSPGYGLIGWTPAAKYQFDSSGYFPGYNQENYPGYGPNWSDIAGIPEDGAAQIKLIGEAMARGSGNIWQNRKACTTSQFIALNDPRIAAYYWLWNVEYPADISDQEPIRMQAAYDWYIRLGGSGAPPWIIFLKKAADNSKGIY